MMRSILLLSLALMSVSCAAAQAPAAHPAAARGQHSLLLEVGRGFGIGYWTKRSLRTDLGVEVGVSYEQTGFERPDRSATVFLSPALKSYLAPRRVLAPYRYLGLSGAYTHSETGGEDFRSIRARASISTSAALGLEWFPIADLSIGGHAGFSASLFSDHERRRIRDQPEQANTVGGFRIGTFASGLRMHLYF